MPEYKQFPLSDTAEGLTEADILTLRVKPGDEVVINQIVVEVETAKAAVELPIPWAGVITELHVEPGQTVEVGAPILTIDVDPQGAPKVAPAAKPAPAAVPETAAAEEEMKPLVGYGSKAAATQRRARKGPNGTVGAVAFGTVGVPNVPKATLDAPKVPLAKPPVRKLAKELGINLRELSGSATNGAITREDVQQAANGTVSSSFDSQNTGSYDPQTRERRVRIKGTRKATAQAMVHSKFTAPHVTEFLTIDVTPMLELREKLKKNRAFAEVKLTPLAFAAKAVCLAITRTPDINAVWDEEAAEIVYKEYVHLGIAAATPRGLIVPKVRDAEAMSLVELAGALTQLTTTAREGKTASADMVNGTFTITNIGVFGIDTGTPIINPGESAILALGAIRDAPWVVEGQLAVRKVMQLSLSFDHRVVDGQQGSEFLANVGALLANPELAITY